jgi:hypothetical protein
VASLLLLLGANLGTVLLGPTLGNRRLLGPQVRTLFGRGEWHDYLGLGLTVLAGLFRDLLRLGHELLASLHPLTFCGVCSRFLRRT